MDIPRDDIEYAKTYLPNFGRMYRGADPLRSGLTIEDPKERAAIIAEVWTEWSSFARNYFMGMLSTLGGYKTLSLDIDLMRNCTPQEALGGRAAVEMFWKRDLALRGTPKRLGGWLFTPVQYIILADEDTNAEVFTAVERAMESTISTALRTRRNFLRQLDDDVDHEVGLQEDFAYFFGSGRPMRHSAKQRNKNYDEVLLAMP